MGKSSMNGPLSMAMLNNQMVIVKLLHKDCRYFAMISCVIDHNNDVI